MPGVSKRTANIYADILERYVKWCAERGKRPIPAEERTLIEWAAWLADGDGRSRSAEAVKQSLCAVAHAHREAGYPCDVRLLKRQGVDDILRRARRKTKTPVLSEHIDVLDLVLALDLSRPRDARDGAIITLMVTSGLKRTEVVGLHWQDEHQDAIGSVDVVECVVDISLVRLITKRPDRIVVTNRLCSQFLTEWARHANLQPGEPVFRPIDRRNKIGSARLGDAAVSEIVKQRVKVYVRKQGKTRAEASAFAKQFSSESLRAPPRLEAAE